MDSVMAQVLVGLNNWRPSSKPTKRHISRLAFAFLDDVRFGVRPELEEGESWDDRVDPETGDFVMSKSKYYSLFWR